MRLLLLSLIAVPFITACGGPSDSTKLSDLSADEAKDLCEELSYSRTVTCSGQTITINSDDCSMATAPSASCTATVGDARDCTDAIKSAADTELCTGSLPAACEKLSTCE